MAAEIHAARPVIVFAATQSQHYREPAVLADRERTNWGIGPDKNDRILIRIMSILTAAVTVIPTCISAILSGLAIKSIPGLSAPAYLMPITLWFCALYVVAGVVSIPLVLFRR